MSNYIQQLYSAKNIRDSKVYPGLNAAKGILILLVILTHALPDGMILYFLYFFHMPVFLSISGYLLKESAFKDGISKYLGKLIYRLIIPWIMASFLYLYFSLGNRHLSEITLTDFLYPFYHLWYVPAYVLGALLCYFVSNYKIPAIPVLIITALFTVFWYIFFRVSSAHRYTFFDWLNDGSCNTNFQSKTVETAWRTVKSTYSYACSYLLLPGSLWLA